jgi:Glycosyl transferase family 11.
MIVIRLEAGLGNQLFQYAYGIAMKQRYGGRLILDRRLVRSDPSKASALSQIADIEPDGVADSLISVVLRYYSGACIRIVGSLHGPADKASLRLARLGVRFQLSPRYLDLDSVPVPHFMYLHGNWMSEKYFAPAVDAVLSSIHPERALGAEARDMARQMAETNSVAVHVRRGDYLSERWRNKLHVCTAEYYERAVAIVREKVERPTFYVFSNNAEETQWVRDNYRFLPEGTVYVPPGASDVEHFSLMAACRHFIIANSTYSWWASYLCRHPDKVVVAPKPWNRNIWDMSDLYCDDWNVIDIPELPD